jgi:hypothetical protein
MKKQFILNTIVIIRTEFLHTAAYDIKTFNMNALQHKVCFQNCENLIYNKLIEG